MKRASGGMVKEGHRQGKVRKGIVRKSPERTSSGKFMKRKLSEVSKEKDTE